MNPHESNEENSWPDTLNLLSDGLKGRLKNTSSEKPRRPTADRRNRTSRPIPAECPHLPADFATAIRLSGQTHKRTIETSHNRLPRQPQTLRLLRQVSLPKPQCGKTYVQTEAPFIAPAGETRLADLSDGLPVISK
ncbi:hypothetical protein [Neisseria elongata]|uniref:hypothetical protein n=1 Tax=Neisseria elongata TaxID=495 RepID=UPI0028D12A06|nr:hypothetical protein [Neisseria elongata]